MDACSLTCTLPSPLNFPLRLYWWGVGVAKWGLGHISRGGAALSGYQDIALLNSMGNTLSHGPRAASYWLP